VQKIKKKKKGESDGRRSRGVVALVVHLDDGGGGGGLFEPVPSRAGDEVEEIERGHGGDEEVVDVDAALVEVLREPVRAVWSAGGAVDDGDHEAAGVAGDGESEEEQGPRDAAHVLGELLVVELDLSDHGEGLGQAGEHLLRHEHEAGGGVAELAAVVLYSGGDEHGGDGERDPDADALQLGDAALDHGEALHGRDEEAVVEGDPQRERQHVEDDEGGLRDLESRGAADAAVGLHCLEHGVGAEVGEHDEVDDPRRPHRQDADEALDLLDLLQRAQGRRRMLSFVFNSSKGGLVEAPELVRVGDLGDEAAVVRRVVQVRAARGREAAVAVGGEEHAREAGEGAALGADADVEARAHEEERAGEAHERGGHGQAQRPAHVALQVDDDGGGHHHGHREGEVVPVEEAGDAAPPRRRARVELIGAERQVAGADPPGAHRDEREGREQHGQRRPRGPCVQRRHGGGDHEQDHAEEGGHGGQPQRGVAAQVGVAEERAQQRRQVGGAREQVQQRRRVRALHPVHRRQVHQQVRRRPDRTQLLERLVPWFILLYFSLLLQDQ
jgi:hypothetical protein